jgi:hypothetical protein
MPELRLICHGKFGASLHGTWLRPRNAFWWAEISQNRPSCKCNEIDSGAFIALIMVILR